MNGKEDEDVIGFPVPEVPMADHEMMLQAGQMVGRQLGEMMAAFSEVHVVANMASRLGAAYAAVGHVVPDEMLAGKAWALLQAVKDAKPGPQG